MSRLGAAVHVVTTAGLAGKTGFTATAVSSVTDQPAMLLVCVNRRSASAPVLMQNGVFCVNTLGAAEERSPTCSPAASRCRARIASASANG